MLSSIEDGYNTSYIDSLIISLFYKTSTFNFFINSQPKDINIYYLQELFNKIIDLLKSNYIISSESINEIRNYSIYCGWQKDNNIINLFPVSEYYKFLIDKFNIKYIQVSNTLIPYIDIHFDNNNNDSNGLNLNILLEKYEINDENNIIPIHINRNNFNIKIDIMKKIKLTNNKIAVFHSVICYSNINPHYYSIITDYNKDWYIHDSTIKPSINKITDIKDINISNKIKNECVMIFYKSFN